MGSLALWHTRRPGEDISISVGEILELSRIDLEKLFARHPFAQRELEVLGRAVRAVVRGTEGRDDATLAWFAEDTGLPDWVDEALLERGQQFFRSWPLPIATTLFCASLPTLVSKCPQALVRAAWKTASVSSAFKVSSSVPAK